jgi:hypothetical protein
MIKIYTNHEFLTSENENYFFPLLAELVLVENSIIHSKYCFTDEISECDLLILPLAINHFLDKGNTNVIKFFKECSKKFNKALWVYSSGDLGLTLNEGNIFVFRMADFKSSASKWSVIMPVFINDPYSSVYKSAINYLPMTEKPMIGYVGHAKGGFKKFLTSTLVYLKENFDIFRKKYHSDYCRFYLSSHVRLNYLKIIQSSNAILSNFIFRDKYRAGVKTKEDRIQTTLEFFDNIRNNQYTFCMRGGGNFSVRFYETLAMGRVPLFVDTDCVLPLEQIINWKDYCVVVKDKNIKQVNKKLVDFHNSLANEEFVNLQKKNRLVWENFLTRANYFFHIHDLFIEQKL